MQDSELLSAAGAVSSVKIESTAKGFPMLTVKCAEGVTEEEIQRLKDLAIRTFEVGVRELAQRMQIAG